MSLIDEAVSKLFGHKNNFDDPNSKEFMLNSFEEGRNIMRSYADQTPEEAMEYFIFENSYMSKYINMVKEIRDESN